MKKQLSILFCLILILAVFPGPAGAEIADLFSNRDMSQEADLSNAEEIQLADRSVTIDHGGVFLLSGSIQNGQILIDANEEDKVQLVLNGVDIHAETGAAIQSITADKVFITTAQGSENTLSSTHTEEDGADGVIYSKTDLTLNGLGSLTITAQEGSGIVCKDSLAITGGFYTIRSASHGISGKDELNIADGTFIITTGGGSAAAEMKASDSFGSFGPFRGASAAQSSEESIKAKGLKSNGSIRVLYGNFTLDCADDAVHAGGDVILSDGSWNIRSADDAIHSDLDVTIQGGSFQIPYCYEGIEGKNVTISGGVIQITSNDDGINATGEETEGNFGRPGMDTGAVITVDGGELTIVSDGDCIDSNGTIVLNGGILKLTCNGNGNTALDSESGITNNGADVTTNDGSENGGGFGRGFMGGDRNQFDKSFGGKRQDSFPNAPADGATGATPPDNGNRPGVTPPEGFTPPSTDSKRPTGSNIIF